MCSPDVRTVLLLYPSEKGTELVLGDGSVVYDPRKPSVILNEWCLTYGSSMNGRIDAVRHLCGVKRKFPILLSERMNLIFFPMRAKDEGPWINASMLVSWKGIHREATELFFLSGIHLTIPYDSRMVKRQMTLCEQFQAILNQNCA